MATQREEIPKDFPKRIKRLRATLGLTQIRLAELMGVSYASVNRWENGHRPSALAWQRIAQAERLGLEGLEGPVVRESQAVYETEEEYSPALDFAGDPEAVKAVAEGERLACGHLFNRAFATELALIDPLPHQRIAVYDFMLSQPRLRLLLADDAGAGKTIMTGLYIREMLTRRLISRVLIVPPAGLVGNWEREMKTLFRLPFRVIAGSDCHAGNPFLETGSDLAIMSLDTLAEKRAFGRLQAPEVAPYDLVVFDEAHKLAADRESGFRFRKTERYCLAEALAGIAAEEPRWKLAWHCHHLLLLTATPHMGKDFPYYCLWRLLEPQALSTVEAFNALPPEARRSRFIRRAKEEMVRFDGTPIYPERNSDTLSYELTPLEGELYELTTEYIQTYYNRARILNRSAARLAMSVFQRRLASSTYALLRSFQRRRGKLAGQREDLRAGRISPDDLMANQRQLDSSPELFGRMTADEEEPRDGREENEITEDAVLAGVVAVNLAELEAEHRQVEGLLALAQRAHDTGGEAKFDKLREVFHRFPDEKLIIFTEHRDTLQFLVRRLEGLGFTGKVAAIHGGMDYREREDQVSFFRRPASEGGATYLVATDAAGEGINLQFCWLMVNYDIPWNPARLEQRLGRIHRYGQKHDPVVIINLVAAGTREGRVLKTLLEKLELIRKELGSDKVFDVVGRLFEGVSLRDYMEDLLDGDEDGVRDRLVGRLTPEQVQAVRNRERSLYGEGGEVGPELPRLNAELANETYCRLLPGYVRGFLERAAPLAGIGFQGDLDGTFSFKALKPGALDLITPVLEGYLPEARESLTVYKPDSQDRVIFLHPGEPVFERLRAHICARFARDACRGALFVDPTAERPYLFHLARVAVVRRADPAFPSLDREETLEYRLVGLRHEEGREVETCPVEHLLLLRGSRTPAFAFRLAQEADRSREAARACALAREAGPRAAAIRREREEGLPARRKLLVRGFAFQEAELAAARTRLKDGDPVELARVKEGQRALAARRQPILDALAREPALIGPGEVLFLAHALVVPSDDPEERKRHDAEVEAIAMRVARAYEESLGARVEDVSIPPLARAAGLTDHPGFDLRSTRPGGEARAIEVKGRAAVTHVELTENEWIKACNLRQDYWLYVVYNCAGPQPRLYRVRDPFGRLMVRAGGVTIQQQEVFQAAEGVDGR